jgi:hypothetical protein
LRSVLPKSNVLLCVFCGQKDSVQRMFIKKCFLFTVGSVCRVKRFITGQQTIRWWRTGWNGGAEVAETTIQRLLCCGFRRTGKATGQVYQCWWRICRERNVFFHSFKYHTFYVSYPFVAYLLTLPRMLLRKCWHRNLGSGRRLCQPMVHMWASINRLPPKAVQHPRTTGGTEVLLFTTILSATNVSGFTVYRQIPQRDQFRSSDLG